MSYSRRGVWRSGPRRARPLCRQNKTFRSPPHFLFSRRHYVGRFQKCDVILYFFSHDQVYNGLFERGDGATSIPVGHIPAGSGNGLACSVLQRSKQPRSARAATLLTLKNSLRPLDLWEVRFGNRDESVPNKTVSFLSFSWGLIADVDLESEKWRWMGALRFELYAVKCVLRKRKYRATMHYVGEEIKSYEEYRTVVEGPSVVLGPGVGGIGNSKAGKEEPWGGVVEDERNNPETTSVVVREGDHSQARSSSPEEQYTSGELENVGDWKTLSTRSFAFVWMTNVKMGTAKANVVPGAHIDDGWMYFLFVKSSISRARLTRILLALDDPGPGHMKFLGRGLGLVRCKAWRFVPEMYRDKTPGLAADRSVPGNFSLDGERIPFGVFEGCASGGAPFGASAVGESPQKGRVFCM